MIDDQQDKQIRRAFLIGNRRTPAQDVEYAFNQLVEMAVRAMSPAINDPYTAITCLDYIGDGLALFLRQGEISPHFYDQDGQLRFVFEPVTFDKLLSTSFDMLRHASCDNVSVLLHMLNVIDGISQETKSLEARQQLLRQVSLIRTESQAGALIDARPAAYPHEWRSLANEIEKRTMSVNLTSEVATLFRTTQRFEFSPKCRENLSGHCGRLALRAGRELRRPVEGDPESQQ